MSEQPILCYVDGCWAYFTTQELSKQWGDDWNDAPYEHNAGAPYAFSEYDAKEGKKPWKIIKVAWEADLEQPCDHHRNSPYSVESINQGEIPWLRSPSYAKDGALIWAGTPLAEFIKLVQGLGGQVYTRQEGA